MFEVLRAKEPDDPSRPGLDPALDRGDTVDRYVILNHIGRGGMGMVYAAYDPDLDRKVALKLVLPHSGADTAAVARARLLREAQALARLAHPNVVSVHDVGTHDDRVWIAMEFVEGQTIRAWATEQPRRWPEVLRVLTDAARGIAAAHATGLIHRDLKPENVMIGDDGRVRVMDFGLAHCGVRTMAEAVDGETLGSHMETASVTSALARSLTVSGAVLGTPAYMAPEQWQRRDVGAAVDQFGWAIMAWELLHDERPFAGETMLELAASVVAGKRRAPPPGRRAPRWLRRTIERALRYEPAQRWPTMAALIAVLEQQRKQTWLRILVLTGMIVVAVGIGMFRGFDRREPCQFSEASLPGVWDAGQRAALRSAFEATRAPQAGAEWRSTEKVLDRYAKAWRDGQAAACTAHEQGRDSDLLFERRRSCLERGRLALQSVMRVLANPTAHALRGARKAVNDLPSLSQCANTEALLRAVAPPDEAKLDAVLALEARMRDLGVRANDASSSAEFRSLEVEARRVGYAPLVAAVLRERATQEWQREDEATVCALLLEGYSLAEAAGDDMTAALNARGMVARCAVPGGGKAQHVAVLSRVARSKLERAGLLGSNDHIRLLQTMAWEAVSRTEYAEAERAIEEALSLAAEQAEPDPLVIADVHADRAKIVSGQPSKWWDPRVSESLTTAIAACTQVLDPDDPVCLAYQLELGTLRALAGDGAGARGLLERPIALLAGEPGRDEASIETTVKGLLALGSLHMNLGEDSIAEEYLQRARQLYPAHSERGASVINLQVEFQLGKVAEMRGGMAAAAVHYEAVLTQLEAFPSLVMPMKIRVLDSLARVLDAQGKTSAAAMMRDQRDQLIELAFAEGGLGFANIQRERGLEATRRGAWQEAEQIFSRTAEELKRTQGSSHPAYLDAIFSLSSTQLARERCTSARQLIDAMAGSYTGGGSEPPLLPLQVNLGLAGSHALCGELMTAEAAVKEIERTAGALGAMGETFLDLALVPVLLRRGEPRDALIRSARQVKFFESSPLGKDVWMLAGVLGQHAEAARQASDLAEARTAAQRTIEMIEGEWGPEHIALAGPLTTLARVELAGDETDAARIHLERALALRVANGSDPPFIAETRFALAEALARRPGQRVRARALALRAAEDYRTAGEMHMKEVARIVVWLEAK